MLHTVTIMYAKFLRNLRLWDGVIGDRISELIFHIFHSNSRGYAHWDPSITADQLDQAINLGVRFLSKMQTRDGYLSGFLLYPGASTTWLTAHVAFVVELIPQLEGLCRKAAKYLSVVGPEDGGWGYNRRVAPDCDSTAQAIMVIHRFGLPIQTFLIKSFIDAQLPCGGFPTYSSLVPTDSPKTGWQIAHPEVSAMAIEALRRVGGSEGSLKRCISWVKTQINRGILPSYWWNGHHYGLWVQARTGLLTHDVSDGIDRILQQSKGIPAIAFVLSAAAELPVEEKTLCSLANTILLEQKADGSWNCQPCLRVTSSNWFQSTPDAPGHVAADKRRVFSTAHSVEALYRVRRRLFP